MIQVQSNATKRANLGIRGLGFESRESLVAALRVSESSFDTALELCASPVAYDRWYEPKRSGGQRLIEHPVAPLKDVQKRLNRLLQRLRLPGIFHGSYSATSIMTNAKPHCIVSWYLTFDLKNYYKAIRPQKVYASLRSVDAPPDIARLITRLTTVSGHVPQGAPTSPMIAAIAMLGLANRLTLLCRKLGAVVTVYGDNVCISGPRAVAGHKRTFLRIAETESFQIRREKTSIVEPSEDKPLPGLVIRNGKPTTYDVDRLEVEATIRRCHELGPAKLSYMVCSRFIDHLRGVVNHYAWIDRAAMKSALEDFRSIKWPAAHIRVPCWSPKCHCTVSR